jgi:hypothetical protein
MSKSGFPESYYISLFVLHALGSCVKIKSPLASVIYPVETISYNVFLGILFFRNCLILFARVKMKLIVCLI